jgi:hypothetical protein
MVYEHEEQWWNDIDRGKLLIRPPQLSGNPTSSHPVPKQEELGEGNYDFGMRSIFVHTPKGFLTCLKILRHATDGFTCPTKKGVLLIFFVFKNPSLRPCLHVRTLGPIASTLTITPPRQLLSVKYNSHASY